MKSKNSILFLIVLVVSVIIISYSFQGGETRGDYVERIKEERREKNRDFKNSDESPLDEERKKLFDSLNYFPPDPAYKVTAKITPVDNKKLLILPMSDGEEDKYIRYATASFSLQGKEHKLLLLQRADVEDPNSLFLAFRDATSGNETYGGGRYIDLQLKSENQIIIDFNKAYNPYCEYNVTYSCPLPPRENSLDISIRAGEKTYSTQ